MPNAKHCLVAVSGGQDSMALLHLCLQAKLPVSVAHMNFGLRAEESMRDEAFVRDTCERLSIACYVQQVDTLAFMQEHQLGTQEAARILRYNFFAELRHQHHFDYVLTAHHASDNVETVLMNLMRGTGSTGITGIPKQRSFYIRPLLHIAKADLNAYLHEHNIEFVEDSSNQSDDYTRNYVRHHLLTKMEELSSQAIPNFSASIQRVQEEQTVYKALFESWLKTHQQKTAHGFILQIDTLRTLPQAATVLRLALPNERVSLTELQKIIHAETGAVMELKHHRILKNRDELVIEERFTQQAASEYYINEGELKTADFECRLYDRTEDTLIDKNRFVAMLDYDQLQFPLLVRNYQHGDSFFPLGMKNKKLVSDFLTNEKVSLFDKERVKVVCSNNNIVWVAGYRIDNRYALTESSKRIFEIRKW
jgi:tRNA(Ile)-lysidine synthase